MLVKNIQCSSRHVTRAPCECCRQRSPPSEPGSGPRQTRERSPRGDTQPETTTHALRHKLNSHHNHTQSQSSSTSTTSPLSALCQPGLDCSSALCCDSNCRSHVKAASLLGHPPKPTAKTQATPNTHSATRSQKQTAAQLSPSPVTTHPGGSQLQSESPRRPLELCAQPALAQFKADG